MRYTDWIDRVLAGLDQLATGDATAALVGVSWHQLLAAVGIEATDQTVQAAFSTARDLELLGCAEGLNQLRVKVTPLGQRIARGDGLRASWPGFFEHVSPLAEDRVVLDKVVSASLAEFDSFATAESVELKEAMRGAGYAGDQGSAIAMAKRLEKDHCIHPNPLVTMGPDGYCQVRPSYIGIVITTEEVAAEHQELLQTLVAGWETTSVEFKEALSLSSERDKAEFCKDVLALANTRVTGGRYLVIGFNDESREFTTTISPELAQERLEAILSAYCQPVPRIALSLVACGKGTAGLLQVSSDTAELPYKLSRDVWKLRANSAFVRHNTLVAVADGEELAALVSEAERVRSGQASSSTSAMR